MMSGTSIPLWIAILAGICTFAAVVWIGRRAFLHGGKYGPFDSRIQKRARVRTTATVYLTAGGRRYLVQTRVGDLSDGGVGVVCPVEIKPASQVHVELPELHLAGAGMIRTCHRRGRSYRIGVQFTEPLTRVVGAEARDAVPVARRNAL